MVFLTLSEVPTHFTDTAVCVKNNLVSLITQAGWSFGLVLNILFTLGLTIPEYHDD